MDGGAWWAAVHGVAKSWTRLSDFTFTFHFHALEKAMATHSSVLAWRLPGTGEPGGLPSLGTRLKRLSSSSCSGGLCPKPCLTLETPWSVACQDPLSMGFSWQEYTEELYKNDLNDLDKPRWCDHSPRARHPGMQSQMGFMNHHYEQS